MSVHLRTKLGEKVIELGGGSNPQIRPNVDVRQCYDQQGNPTVDFTADFNEPLPIQSDEWDGVFSNYVIEHLSWRKVKGFIAEIFRVLKPGGKAVFVTANTLAQIEWLKENPEGWDGKDHFESASCIIFGDQDYEHNAHKNFMTPGIAHKLFLAAGFVSVSTVPTGTRNTDMMIEAVKPSKVHVFDTSKPGFWRTEEQERADRVKYNTDDSSVFDKLSKPVDSEAEQMIQSIQQQNQQGEQVVAKLKALVPPEVLFDRHYFNGGSKVGGYANEGLRDFPVHEVTARHVLYRKPESVLELGCARGYVIKRLQDAGIVAAGLEVSKHCIMTRVVNSVIQHNLCHTPWPIDIDRFDLSFSIATLEHIPEEHLPAVIREMQIRCKRGLHGIDFGGKDDGFDQTHCTLRPRQWWVDKFKQYAPGWQVEILDKEELEAGPFPREVLEGDGKVKLNIGSFNTMFHHGWVNIDVHDLAAWAQGNGYRYARCDVSKGLPFGTGTVDLIYCGHMLEHLTYAQGRSFLKDCRRVLKPDTGAMRILVPDAKLLTQLYVNWEATDQQYSLTDFDEINDGCANAPTWAGKYWALLHEGHQAAYDAPTLIEILKESGFSAWHVPFRHSIPSNAMDCGHTQILKETLDTFPCLSLIVAAVPSA